MLTLGGPGPCSQFMQRLHFPFLWKYHNTTGTGEPCPLEAFSDRRRIQGSWSTMTFPDECAQRFACGLVVCLKKDVFTGLRKRVSWQLSCFVVWLRHLRTVLSSFNLSRWWSLDCRAEGSVWLIEGNHEWPAAPWCCLDPWGRKFLSESHSQFCPDYPLWEFASSLGALSPC